MIAITFHPEISERIDGFINGDGDQKVTYYQWANKNGEMVISRAKPTNETAYITFEGSKNLISNQNNVDQDLISRGNAYKTTQSKKAQPIINPNKKRPTNKAIGSSIGPFNAITKTKHCLALSNKIAEANRDAKEISELKRQYSAEC
jgi:hypothetical protein